METENFQSDQTLPLERPGMLSRLIMVFTSPARLPQYLTTKIEWLTPLIVIAILGGVMSYVTRPIIAKDMLPATMRNIEKYRQQMGEEQFAKIKAQIDEGFEEARNNPFKWYYVLVDFGLPFVIFAVISAIGMVTGSFLFGGKSTFWTVMNVVAYAALIGLLGDLVRGALTLAKDSMYVYTGLGLIKPVDDGSFPYYLLRQIDVFSVWRIVATCIGLGVVYKMKPTRFVYVLFGIWAVFIVLVSIANLFTGGTIVY